MKNEIVAFIPKSQLIQSFILIYKIEKIIGGKEKNRKKNKENFSN